MTEDITHAERHKPSTASWALWPKPGEGSAEVRRHLDRLLCGFLFYPEIEWRAFGYRPPDTRPLLSAWRDAKGQVFAFLLGGPAAHLDQPQQELLLYVAGTDQGVRRVEETVAALKAEVTRADKRELAVRSASRRLDAQESARSLSRLLQLVGIFTVVTNAFSLYLRRLPTPSMPNPTLVRTYEFLVSAIHISALGLLLLVILISIGFVLRYGALLLKRF